MRWTKLSELSSWKFWRVAQLSTSEWIYFKHPVYSYSGSRGSFSKYLIWNKPFLLFDKTSEMVIFFSRRARTISIDETKISSGTQGSVFPVYGLNSNSFPGLFPRNLEALETSQIKLLPPTKRTLSCSHSLQSQSSVLLTEPTPTRLSGSFTCERKGRSLYAFK